MKLTLEQLKKIITSDEDVIVFVDGSILIEIDEEEGEFILGGSDIREIDEDILECIELLEYKELDINMETIYAVHKEDVKNDELFNRKFMALDTWNMPIVDIEEEVLDYGMRRIEKIVKINKVKSLKRWGF